ncbi:hypothetical protein WN51_06313 [Melipona quadrifasciata]|uniref:Uncharacterized protein n=1 Tax=Melipona quadrifasciata TaxID=166423 RepID=A0A0M8ZQN8_9HYME|nr:hypothetical protein WN51_06313 [Melipona quadrifasciata]
MLSPSDHADLYTIEQSPAIKKKQIGEELEILIEKLQLLQLILIHNDLNDVEKQDEKESVVKRLSRVKK